MVNQISEWLNLPGFAMPPLSISAFLDIALIAFVVYKLLIWTRKTRAWSLFKGITILAIVYFLALIIEMHTTIWIINQTLNIAIIALIIIFQPEIRRALERMGRTRGLPFINNLEEGDTADAAQVMEDIVQAAVQMSKTMTGALIVIEKETPLGDLETTGVAVDALVSTQLLLNIFQKNAPMHDGAVLVRENRVKAATCILPLTTSQLSKELGTRHRAALGVSETSDAYALIVSEETGNISIAKDGQLFRNLNEDELRDILISNKSKKKNHKGNKYGFGIRVNY